MEGELDLRDLANAENLPLVEDFPRVIQSSSVGDG